MNISDVKRQVEGASYENEVGVLETICNKAGDVVTNGFLGSSVTNISYDPYGKVEFESENNYGGIETKSIGAVLDDSVIIKQTQKQDNNTYAQLFSWKKDGSSFTFIALDNEDTLNLAYNNIKIRYPKFLGENIEQELNELDIPIDKVMNVKVAQQVETAITAASMLDEAESEKNEQAIGLESPVIY